jgi:hypothetical protein
MSSLSTMLSSHAPHHLFSPKYQQQGQQAHLQDPMSAGASSSAHQVQVMAAQTSVAQRDHYNRIAAANNSGLGAIGGGVGAVGPPPGVRGTLGGELGPRRCAISVAAFFGCHKNRLMTFNSGIFVLWPLWLPTSLLQPIFVFGLVRFKSPDPCFAFFAMPTCPSPIYSFYRNPAEPSHRETLHTELRLSNKNLLSWLGHQSRDSDANNGIMSAFSATAMGVASQALGGTGSNGNGAGTGSTGHGGGGGHNLGRPSAGLSNSSEDSKVLNVVAELLDGSSREQALLELSKKREQVEELPLIIWHSFGKFCHVAVELFAKTAHGDFSGIRDWRRT